MSFQIDWQKCDGLLPVITQDYLTKDVLMMAYMNEEAYGLTLGTKEVHYYSRTKARIWKKGESSGHIQQVKQILLDCDSDCLLILVEQLGVCCHTGRSSCFYRDVECATEVVAVQENTKNIYGVVDSLFNTITDKKFADPKVSYTAKLIQGKQNSMLKKIIEEAGEFTFAIKDDNKEEIVYEAADLLYHSLVALASKNISPDQVRQEIARRFGLGGLEEKNSRVAE